MEKDKKKIYVIDAYTYSDTQRQKIYLIDALTELLSEIINQNINSLYDKLEYSTNKNKLIINQINNLKEELELEWFKSFVYSFKNRKLSINIDEVAEVLHKYNFNKKGDIFTLLNDYDVLYYLPTFDLIELEKEEKILKIFIDVNNEFILKLSHFIELKYWLSQYENKNNQTIIKTPQPQTIDLSNTKGTEKIIMLKQLGILDFLKEKQPFNLSTNALASALSGITGIKTDTLQSYINPIDNPSVNQKNNPLNSEKSVNKVTQKLISIGFTPTK